jgi:acetyl-CoA synthetase
VHINRKVLVVKRTNTPITMKRAEIFGCNLLDGASDNSVAEIMDSKILYSFYIPPVRQENRKEWFTTAGYMVYTAYTFKNVFNYEERYLLVYG